MAQQACFHAGFLNCHSVLTEHSIYRSNDFSSWDLFDRIVSRSLNSILGSCLVCVDRAVCVSGATATNLAQRTGVPRESLTVIPNAVDTNIFQPKQRQLDGFLRIIVVGRLSFRRG